MFLTLARPKIRADIEARMKATGTTDLAGGLALGLQQVQSQARTGEINRIVLVSDGVPNDESTIAGLAQQARSYGVPITALGLGLEYHETLLGQLAQGSGGKFHFVEDPAKVANVFREEVLSIDSLAARSLALTLTPGPGVSILEVPGWSPGYNARATDDPAELEQGVDLEVATAAARATTASATLQIVALARAGDVKGATKLLDRTVEAARKLHKAMPDTELARLVDDLVELRPTLKGLAPQPVAVDRSKHVGSVPGGAGAGPDMAVGGTAPPTMAAPEPMSPASARGGRASKERAYKVLHGE